MERTYFIDNGREYISWDDAQNELDLDYMSFTRLLGSIGFSFMLNHNFNGKSYLERSYFEECVLRKFNHLKQQNRLHVIQWRLPDSTAKSR